MNISSIKNAYELTRQDQRTGLILYRAVRHHYPGIGSAVEELTVLRKINDESRWPFFETKFPRLVNLRHDRCSFIVHRKWLETAFIASDKTIRFITNVVVESAGLIDPKLTLTAFICPSDRRYGYWNSSEDRDGLLPIEAIKKMIVKEFYQPVIEKLILNHDLQILSADIHELVNDFLAGIADKRAGMQSFSRQVFETAKDLEGLAVKVKESYQEDPEPVTR